MCNVTVVFTDGTERDFRINELKDNHMRYVNDCFVFITPDDKVITVVARNVNFIEIEQN